MTKCSEHVHVVIFTKRYENHERQLCEVIDAASQLVSNERVHLVVSQASPSVVAAISRVPEANVVVEPTSRGDSAAVAYAGCHLYRMDPTAVMILVDGDPATSTDRLRANFQQMADAAELPGSLVSLSDCQSQSTGLFAWSIYALMESYRNCRPVDFQIINELARRWNQDLEHSRTLYEKLLHESIESRLLDRIRPGYPTRLVRLAETLPAAPISGGDVSDTAIIAARNDTV